MFFDTKKAPRGAFFNSQHSPTSITKQNPHAMKSIVSLICLIALLSACAEVPQEKPALGAVYSQRINPATAEVIYQITHQDPANCQAFLANMRAQKSPLFETTHCTEQSAAASLPFYAEVGLRFDAQTLDDCSALFKGMLYSLGISDSPEKLCKRKPLIPLNEQAETEQRYFYGLCTVFATESKQVRLITEKQSLLTSLSSTKNEEIYQKKTAEFDALMVDLANANQVYALRCLPRVSCFSRSIDRKLCDDILSQNERARMQLTRSIYALELFEVPTP